MPDSIASEYNIQPGDFLISINNEEIHDIFDYQYHTEDVSLDLEILTPDHEIKHFHIDKDEDEDLGLVFENGFMDDYRSCCNKCIFCFIDQMPPGMRETLYFKDDDSRLSFLQGNYVTLTNMSDYDLNRIIRYRLSPINVSFQTTNPELRCKMLNNRFAGEALKKVDRLFEAGIAMNGQIVLCKDVNDGDELKRSIEDLMKYIPLLESVSVVPVGLSKFRDGLYPLEPFTKEDAAEVLKLIKHYQSVIFEQHGIHFIHASDEFYLLAEEELPHEDTYDGYLQLENGVGMLRLLINEFEDELSCLRYKRLAFRKHTVSVATGLLAYPIILNLCNILMEKLPKLTINVYPIRNDFFGEMITVSGLITGQDLIAQLQNQDLGEKLFLPQNMLRSGEDVFLDDVTLDQLESTLQVKIDIVKSSGQDFVYTIGGDFLNE